MARQGIKSGTTKLSICRQKLPVGRLDLSRRGKRFRRFYRQSAGPCRFPPRLDSWQENIAEFMGIYVAEQIHLAQVFPDTSSEIELFNDHEFSGDRTSDRKFFLTFDDGPTAFGGNTDGVLQMLNAQKKSAVFFVMGKSFANRQRTNGAAALKELYQGQCVGAHGWEHLSHEKRSRYAVGNKWQSSVTETIALLKNSFDDTSIFLPLFSSALRPAQTGERRVFSKRRLAGRALEYGFSGFGIPRFKAEDVINRMVILMLIKRRGVLLFHDIHPKAQKAVPAIIAEFGSAVEWGDCHRIAEQ